MNGVAYVFLRKDGAHLPTGPAGHVGWGFRMEDGTYFCGSTENESANPVVLPGGDNDAWTARVDTEAEMLELFRARSYDGYKLASVRNCTPEAAREVGEAAKQWGYAGVFNNCADHACKVLAAYGDRGLPWLQLHPSPNDWFALYNGEYRNLFPAG